MQTRFHDTAEVAIRAGWKWWEIGAEQRRPGEGWPWAVVLLPATAAERRAVKAAGYTYDHRLRGWVR